MPNVGDKVVPAGKIGVTGYTGSQGQTWSDNPPVDSQPYGRLPGSWVPLLPLTGGTLSNGIVWSNMVSSAANNPDKHIRLSTNNNGISVLGNTLNFYGIGAIRCYLSGLDAILIGSSSGNPYINFTNGSFPFFLFTTSTAALDFQADSPGGTMKWQSGRFDFWGVNSGCYIVGELWLTDVGARPYTSVFTNGHNWRWDGTWMYTRVDNSVEYPVAVQCDERMKQDIVPSELDALEVVRKIRLYQFRWMDHPIPGKVRRNTNKPIIPIGLIAQRLYEDFPDAVKTGGVFKGAIMMWTPERFTLLAALCRAVQQMAERVEVLRNA